MSRPLHPLCISFLHREEGLRLQTYDDKDGCPLVWDGNAWRRTRAPSLGATPLGFPTIGRGRRLWPGEIVQTCTLEQADAWFYQRLEQVDLPAVDRYWPDANDFQRGALVDRSYNAGSAANSQDKLREIWLSGGPSALKAAWLSEVHGRMTSNGVLSAVLVGRRAREWALFCHDWEPTAAELEDVLMSIRATGAQMVLELPSLAGVILSEDESPH